MDDITIIRQGAIFYIADLTVDESNKSITFGATHFPQKCRPWLIVSNNIHNANADTISMVPIYTRDTTAAPTQVFFKNGTRNQVIDCSMIASIPKAMIKAGSYIGTVSPFIWAKVNKALAIQFGDSEAHANTNTNTENTEETTMDTFTEMIIEAVERADVRNIIVDKLSEILVTGLTNGFNSIVTNTVVQPIEDTTTKEVINTEANPDMDDNMYDPVIISLNKYTKNHMTYTKPVEAEKSVETATPTTTIEIPKSKGRKHMSDSMCIQFFADAENMTLDELNTKYAGYCYCKNKTELNKKINKQRKRLVEKGLITA